MSAVAQTSASLDQRKQIIQIVQDVAEKAMADFDPEHAEAERILSAGDEFGDRVYRLTSHLLEDLSFSEQFAGEEVPSSLGYFSGYQPKNITQQTNDLRQLFPNCGFANEDLCAGQLPHHAEGWSGAVPWQEIAPTYHGAVQIVLDLLKKVYGKKFWNWREDQLGPDHLQYLDGTEQAFARLRKQQEGYNLLILPTQLGERHKGRSVMRAEETYAKNEFGLDVFTVGVLLLTHPERLQHDKDLRIDCPGNRYKSPSGDFDCVPGFSFRSGALEFGARSIRYASRNSGAATGFLF